MMVRKRLARQAPIASTPYPPQSCWVLIKNWHEHEQPQSKHGFGMEWNGMDEGGDGDGWVDG